MGNHVYLTIPKRGALNAGHAMVIPMQHLTALNLADDDVWNEVMVCEPSGWMTSKIQRR
jgi:hypothetical protein